MRLQHSLRVMSRSSITWFEDDPTSVAQAREVFDDLFRRGHAIFRAQVHGALPASKITEFDATVRDMIAVPPVTGG